jgi:bifunctional enzyme CysN/CysC
MALDLLRVATAGSVDDGKSTLIGRLLLESRALFDDHLDALERARADSGSDVLDLAAITDGLRAEREQGITIDVAYRFFSTPRRRFVLADTPGHEQYTRNMATGASNADVAIVLCDASRGLTAQSRRHAWIAGLLGVPHLVVCVNKMDLVDYDETAFTALRDAFRPALTAFSTGDVRFVPISALQGDNVTERSPRMPWHTGPTLMEILADLPVPDRGGGPARFPVQQVVRHTTGGTGRAYAGMLASGSLAVGDDVVVQPGGLIARIARIATFDGDLAAASAGQSVTVHLDREVDCSRGDLLATAAEPATVTRDLAATVVWFAEQPLHAGRQLLIKHTTRTTRAIVTALDDRVDMRTLEREATAALAMNDIGRCRLRTADPLAIDPYALDRTTGSAILIDPASNDTVGAVIIDGAGDAP